MNMLELTDNSIKINVQIDNGVITSIPSPLYIYTWNSTCQEIECSYLKIHNNTTVSINFDDDNEQNFNYKGDCNFKQHAIFINTVSESDQDMCQIILLNDVGFAKDYVTKKKYFNVGIMSSFGRRNSLPEAKSVFVIDDKLDNQAELLKFLKVKLKNTEIDKNLLKEISLKIK